MKKPFGAGKKMPTKEMPGQKSRPAKKGFGAKRK